MYVNPLFKHCYVINLDRQPERWRGFKSRFKTLDLGIFQRLSAVDGTDIDRAYLRAQDIASWPFWLDPYSHRLMTAGEVGCLLSHHHAWRKIAQSDDPALVLEDDAQPSKDFSNMLIKLSEDIGSRCWDLIYLGHKQLEKRDATSIAYIEPGYTYWTVAYILSPTGANKLLNTLILRNMVPVDEYLPVMFDRHPNQALCTLFRDNDKLDALAAMPKLVEPAFNQGASQTEASRELTDGLQVVTVATDPDKAAALVTSLERFGHQYAILGAGEVWRGGDMTTPGGGQKINLLRDYLKSVDESAIILFVDGYDVIINADARTILIRYALFYSEIVFAAEKACWPDPNLASAYPDTASEYRYLNSGSFIGRASAIKRIVDAVADDADDQLFFSRIFVNDNAAIKLDTGCTLFQTASFAEADIVLAGRQLKNVLLDSNPVVLHGNGGDTAKQFFSQLVKRLNNSWAGLSIADLFSYEIAGDPNNAWSTPAADILQLTFWTPEFCHLLIETAELLNEWQKMEYDKVPGQELRIQRISPRLFEHIETHFKVRVVPWLQQVWRPYFFNGLKDAFIIKYSTYSQRALTLHNDIAHVSASIKLNDSYTGGVLEFPRQQFNNADVPVGTMLVWPSSVTHPHQSTEITSGTKYSLTLWTNPEV